jgi:hypothetical protein
LDKCRTLFIDTTPCRRFPQLDLHVERLQTPGKCGKLTTKIRLDESDLEAGFRIWRFNLRALVPHNDLNRIGRVGKYNQVNRIVWAG